MSRQSLQVVALSTVVTAAVLVRLPVPVGFGCAVTLAALWCWLLEQSAPEPVSDPGLTLDVPRVADVRFDFLAKLPNQHPQVFRLIGNRSSPHRFQQRSMGHHSSGIPRQDTEQIEFLWSQSDLIARADDAAAVEVNDEIADFESPGAWLLRPEDSAQCRPHASE